MLALDVIFDFACCCCGHDVGVTLRCESGNGNLAERLDLPASAKVPCPTCGEIIVIYFTPRGTLLRVAPNEVRVEVPEPSCN
jgi:hypothetical protein